LEHLGIVVEFTTIQFVKIPLFLPVLENTIRNVARLLKSALESFFNNGLELLLAEWITDT
jgi:hypothetical protein